jgi:hypothetical protein
MALALSDERHLSQAIRMAESGNHPQRGIAARHRRIIMANMGYMMAMEAEDELEAEDREKHRLQKEGKYDPPAEVPGGSSVFDWLIPLIGIIVVLVILGLAIAGL